MYTSVLISVNASHPETAVQALENFPGGGGGGGGHSKLVLPDQGGGGQDYCPCA